MQNARVFFTLACMLVGVAIAPGCETKPSGGNGGEGGEPTGVGGAGVGGSGGGGTAGGGTGGAGTGGGGTAGGSNASSSSSSSSGSGGDAEPPFMNGMTAAHNAARASVSPAPSVAIPPLTWSGEVAAVAQAYAENCVFQHSNNQYGENLFATSGGANPQGVVDSWVSEAADYNYAANTCSNMCGHYTQVVWRDSMRLGCGRAVCNKNSPFGGGTWEIWVCNYDPPGNYLGERPY